MSDLADALIAGSRAAPKLDPAIVYGIAQSSDAGDVADHATATQAFSDIGRRVEWLRSEDGTTQSSYWSSIDDGERKMLQTAGYTAPPPVEPSKHRGFWGSVGHGLGNVADVALVKPAEALQHGAGEALHLLGAPLRNLQHAYRAELLLTRPGFDEGNSIGDISSPSDWARAWRESMNGERTFHPEEEPIIRSRYSPETADLAKQIASKTPIDKIILAAPEGDRAALAARIQSDPELKAAVADYESIKLSPGRQLLGPVLQKKLMVKLPESVPFMGGAEINPISGGLDAVVDWYADPIVVGAKTAKAAELSRYAVQGPEDVQRLIDTNVNVQRAIEDASATLNAGGAGALIERWPRLAPVAEQLVKEGVDSPEKLGEWFQGQSGMASLLSGRSTGVSRAVPQMLKLNPRETAMLSLKGGLKRSIDWMADTPLGIATRTGDEAQAAGIRGFAQRRVQGFGRFTRQATTLVQRGHSFDPASEHAITQIQRLANEVLPAARTRDIVDLWAAAPDLATKRQIYKGLLGEMFDRAGITATEDGRNWASGFISKIDDAVDKPIYSAAGHDSVLRDGIEARRGLLEPHLTTEWAMPPFRELWAQSKRANTIGRVYQGTINNDGISKFMESVWKPTTLLRLGFPIRAGGEELVAAIMREGPLGLIRGRAAMGAAKGEALGVADRILPYHPLSRIWDGLAGHLPNELVARIEQPADYIGVVFGDRTRRAFRQVEGALVPEHYMKAARELWTRGELQGGFLSEISAVHARAAGYLDDTPTLIKAVREGDTPRPAFFEARGNFINYKPGESVYVQMWRKNLDEVAESKLGQAALANIEDPEAAVRAVQDVILSPGFEKMAARSDRMLQTSDGRIVGEQVTREEAARDWAEAVVDHTNSLVRDEQGALIGDLHTRLAAGEVPTAAGLAETPVERMPTVVKGREVVQVSRNWARDVMDRGFQQVVGRPMDWMVRQPLFIHNYALAQREVEGLRAVTGGGEHADQIVHDVAMQRAINKTIPYIHDPQLKSQMSVVTRNLAPFWFAQEQFYKRWAKILVHSPEAFRQAQLVMMGLRHSGVLHTDDQGNDYFIYPGAAAVQDVITAGLEKLPGQKGKWKLPLPVGFSGQVRFATPGLERLGVPSFGPLVGIPMVGLTQMFPELETTEQAVLGERGAGRSYWEMVTPTTVSRLVHIAIDSPDTSPQMASAMMQAIQYLAAAGYAPPENAPPDVVEHWKDRVRNWTRILFLNRMVYGYTVPASPETQMDPNNLSDEFRGLLKSMPIEEAQGEFLRRHPDATPYTVFMSKSASGAPLPATEHTVKFMADHEQFLSSYPQAGGWFLPQVPEGGDEPFSIVAYREQLALELRQRKSPDQYLHDVYFAQSADQYFRNRDRKDAALTAAKGNSGRQQAINHGWDQWKTDYLATHPVFAAELLAPDAEIRQQETVDQLRRAATDPRLPDTPQARSIIGLLNAYNQVDAALHSMAGYTSAAVVNRRKAIRESFGEWAERYVTEHPEVKTLYQKTFQPLVETS